MFRPLASTLIVGTWNSAFGGESGALMQSQTRNEDSLEFVNNKERVQLAELHKSMVSHQREHKQELNNKLSQRHGRAHLTKHRDSVTGVVQSGGARESMKKTARDMEHEYRAILELMVQQPKLGNEYQPPVGMIDAVEAVFDTIEGQLSSEKDTLQKDIDDANALIKQCNDDKDDAYTRGGGINDRKSASDSKRTQHHTCRTDENRLICSSKVACDAFNTKQAQSCSHEQNWYVKFTSPEVVDHATVSLMNLVNQAGSCRGNLTAEHTKASECDGVQSQFEIAFCQYADRLQKVSDAYDGCYADQTLFRKNIVDAGKILERDNKLIWKMSKKVRCYMDAIKNVEYTNTPPLQKDIDDCVALDPDTSPLDIAYTEPEPKEPCDLSTIEHWPGQPGGQWYNDEYGGVDFQRDCKSSPAVVPAWQAALHPQKLQNVQVCSLMNAWHQGQSGGNTGLLQKASSV